MTDEVYKPPQSNLDPIKSRATREYAGFWERFFASFIDGVLMLLVILPLMYVVYGAEYFFSEAFLQGPIDFIVNYILPPITICLFWVVKRATPGKMAMGIEVVKLNSEKSLGFGNAIGRYLGYYLSAVVLFLGFIWVVFDKRNQAWHDKLAGTVVVKR